MAAFSSGVNWRRLDVLMILLRLQSLEGVGVTFQPTRYTRVTRFGYSEDRSRHIQNWVKSEGPNEWPFSDAWITSAKM